MVNGMALGDLWLVQEVGTPVTYVVYFRYKQPDIHDDIWAPHRALDDGTLGPGVEYLAHTCAKVHHPGPYPGTHPSPHALCYIDTDAQVQTHRRMHTYTHTYVQSSGPGGEEAWEECMYHCTVARRRVP